jgi:cell division protein FtsZ
MENNNPKIKVIGVGGCGCNAVDHMIESIKDVEFYGLNTDLQALEKTSIPNKIQIGKDLTKGLGAGSDPEIGKQSAQEDKETIDHILENAEMVFITAGMGGGTGTGAAPECAKYAKEKGILTIGVITKPFTFENRDKVAEEGIRRLSENVDSIIIIPNQKLLESLDENISFLDAFSESNNVLQKSVKGISDLLTNTGVVNVDFADVKKVMSNSGNAMMGLGFSNSENKVYDATMDAINSNLLENGNINGAKSILINVSGGLTLSLKDYNEVGKIIKEHADPDAIIISGMSINHELDDNIMVTIVATNLLSSESPKEEFFDNSNLSFLMQTTNKIKESIKENESKKEVKKEYLMDLKNDNETTTKNQQTKNNIALEIPSFLKHNDS